MSQTYIARSLRRLGEKAARHQCGYCLTSEHIIGSPLEIEHSIPEALGGQTVEANLWLACSSCNQHEGTRIAALDPVSGQIVPLFHARQQQWKDHFQWSDSGEYIIGISPIGRATVSALELNRPSLVVARRAWVSVGWHPPRNDEE